MMKCKRCSGTRIVKSGIVVNRQRYQCKDCNYHFTLNNRNDQGLLKRQAIHLYLEGLGFRAISRILGVSDVTVGKWLRPLRSELDPVRKQKLKSIELHKVEHFFLTKEIFQRYGWLLIGLEENEHFCLLGSNDTGNRRLFNDLVQ